MSTAAEAAVDNAPAPPPAPSALRHTVSLKRTISRTGSDNSLVDDAVAKQNTQHDCLRYNISFIFEKLHRKREAVGGSLMEQRIKSVLARGKKGVIMIPGIRVRCERGPTAWIPSLECCGSSDGACCSDTIIYKHGYPLAWYFTSVDGTIKRKKPENVNPNAITHAFEDDDDPLRVVAFFVSTTWDTAVNPTNTMTFMDSRELNRFVHTQNPMSEGFLQRWVPYKGEKHGHKKADTTLHVTWTPFKTLVEQRTNLMPRRNRAPGEDIDKSRLLNIQETKTDVQTLTASNKLHVRVAAVCEQIAAHLYAVTTDKLCVHGLTGYFKLTKGNRLYFLWASSITAEPAPCSLVIDSVGTITGRHSPPVIVPKFHGSIKASLDHKEDVVDLKPPAGTPCRICGKTGDSSCSYAVTYAMLMVILLLTPWRACCAPCMYLLTILGITGAFARGVGPGGSGETAPCTHSQRSTETRARRERAARARSTGFHSVGTDAVLSAEKSPF